MSSANVLAGFRTVTTPLEKNTRLYPGESTRPAYFQGRMALHSIRMTMEAITAERREGPGHISRAHEAERPIITDQNGERRALDNWAFYLATSDMGASFLAGRPAAEHIAGIAEDIGTTTRLDGES